MGKILILDPDDHFAAALAKAVRAAGDFSVASTSTVREACLVAAQERCDLAFIPLAENDNAARALRSLQPDLAIYIVTERIGEELPGHYQTLARGVLPRTQMREVMPRLLASVPSLRTPALEDEAGRAGLVDGNERQAEEALQVAVAQEGLAAAVLLRRGVTVAVAGEVAGEQVDTIAARVGETWHAQNTAQIQFIRLATRTADLLLFTRVVRDDLLLTLVAEPQHDVSALRELAASVVQQVGGSRGSVREGADPALVVTTADAAHEVESGVSYALVWQPRRRLPETLHAPLRRALERVAGENGCQLTHVEVTPELIHVVVACRDVRTSAAVARLFKHGSEAAIQAQFGIPAQMWEAGYYATETSEPLRPAELALFLGGREG
jgi:hypothetical protein